MRADSPWRIDRSHGETAGVRATRQSRRHVPTQPVLRVVRARVTRPRADDAATAARARSASRRWRARTRCSCAGIRWSTTRGSSASSRPHSYRIAAPSIAPRGAVAARARSRRDRADRGDARPARRRRSTIVRRLDPRCRRRVLLVVWRPARDDGPSVHRIGHRRLSHAAGARVGSAAARGAPRARGPRCSIFAERSEWRSALPEVNHLNGSIGPESSGVRLSDREFLLYDILVAAVRHGGAAHGHSRVGSGAAAPAASRRRTSSTSTCGTCGSSSPRWRRRWSSRRCATWGMSSSAARSRIRATPPRAYLRWRSCARCLVRAGTRSGDS